VSHLIQEIGIVIFLVLSLYFFFFSKKKQIPQQEVVLSRKTGRFLKGILLSLFYVFSIPFYFIFIISIVSFDYFSFEKYFVFWFAIGASLGAMMVFYLYVVFVKKIEHKTTFFMQNVNYLLGSITFLIAVLGIIRLFNE